MITLEQAVELVALALKDSIGGEIYISKIPSMKVIDIAKTIDKKNKIKFIGVRPGEKIHESMISKEDSFIHMNIKNILKFYHLLITCIKIKIISKMVKFLQILNIIQN